VGCDGPQSALDQAKAEALRRIAEAGSEGELIEVYLSLLRDAAQHSTAAPRKPR
jgi:hypothetical protein